MLLVDLLAEMDDERERAREGERRRRRVGWWVGGCISICRRGEGEGKIGNWKLEINWGTRYREKLEGLRKIFVVEILLLSCGR